MTKTTTAKKKPATNPRSSMETFAATAKPKPPEPKRVAPAPDPKAAPRRGRRRLTFADECEIIAVSKHTRLSPA